MRSALNRWWVFGVREWSAHRARALTSGAVVAVSTALLVTVLSIIGSIDRSLDDFAGGTTGDAALEVSAFSGAGIPAALRTEVAAVPGVAAAVPLVQTPVTTARGTALLIGTDATATALHSPLQDHLRILPATPDGVLAGPNTGFAAGESIALQDTGVTVAAVLDGVERFDGGRFLLAPLPLAQRAAGRGDRIDSVLIVAEPGTDPAALRRDVTAAVAGRAGVGEPAAHRAAASNGVQLIRFVSVSAAGMSFLVAAFLIYTAMGLAIAGRRQRIAMLRALGATRRSIVADLLAETAVSALFGALAGAALGLLLGRAAVGRLPDIFLQSVSARIEFAVPWWTIPLAVVAAVAVCVAAAALAARQVYRVSPVEALAPVGVSPADRVRPAARIGAAVLAAVLAVAAVLVATGQPGILANGGISTMFAAEIAAGFAVGAALVRAAAAVANRCGGAGALAAETIRRSPKRSWATLMTVAVAVAASFAISAGNSNAVTSTEKSFEVLRGADIWVSTTPAGTFPTGPRLPADTADRLRALPSISTVVADQATYVDLGEQRALAYGVAPGSANALLDAAGPEVARRVLDGAGAVVSRDLADALSLEVGDTLTVPSPTGAHAVPILAEVAFFSALNGALALGLPLVQQWFGDTGTAALQLGLAPGADPGAALDQVRGAVPPGVHVHSGDAAVRGFAAALDQATSLNHLIWIIVTIIAAVALLNTLLLSVLERRREIGVLRAIGAARRFAVATVLAEAAGLAVVGGVLGLAFGSVQQVVADLASSRAWNVDVAFAPVPGAYALALGALLLCLLGALPAAWHVSTVNIIEAMRVE
ncbi:ABC transporter permease [Nocardia jiangsuensis]|uniref:ABC transporter permease n=1 Tax=Nocardia jiangsuensis TaxID=1691563 RepID=A0ABV8E0R0_9NOCA